MGAFQAEKYTKTTDKIAKYIGHEYTMGPYIRTTIEILTPSVIDAPDDLNDAAFKVEMFMWHERIK